MRTLSRLSRLAALPLAAGLLVACGGNGSSDGGDSSSAEGGGSSSQTSYCDQLKSAKASLEGFGGPNTDAAAIEDFFSTMQQLADAAPSEIEAEWQQLDSAITKLQDSLKQAGLEVSDFAQLQQSQQLPKGVTQQDLQPVIAAAQDFASQDNTQAFNAIEKHGQDQCNVDLGGSGSSPSESPSESPSS